MPASSTEEGVLIDCVVFEALRADVGAALDDLLLAFLEEVRQQHVGLQALRESRDGPGVRSIAHGLKGCSGYFGAQRLQSSAERLEAAAGRAMDWSVLEPLLDETCEVILATRDALAAEAVAGTST